MNSKTSKHGQDHLDFLRLYVLQALTSSQMLEVENRIADCSECRMELEKLRPVVRSFASWPTDVLRPSESLWPKLANRIAEETGKPPLLPAPEPPSKPEWEEAAPGIFVKLLASDRKKNRVSMLVRLAPGTDYPPHRHADIEELHLLHGELMVDEKTLYPGDYLRAEAGTMDHRVWSETGCTCILLTSTKDEIL